MREPTYHILAALLDGPLHGYAITKRVEEASGGRVRLAAGTLYAALDRLADETLIQVVDEQTVNGRARRYYGLTDGGLTAVHAEAIRMAEAAHLVTGRPTATTNGRPAGATNGRPGVTTNGGPAVMPA